MTSPTHYSVDGLLQAIEERMAPFYPVAAEKLLARAAELSSQNVYKVGPCTRCGAVCEDDAAFDVHQCLPENVSASGWQLVPVEYTPEMRFAYNEACKHSGGGDTAWLVKKAWKAMLAAAPEPPK